MQPRHRWPDPVLALATTFGVVDTRYHYLHHYKLREGVNATRTSFEHQLIVTKPKSNVNGSWILPGIMQ